MRRGCKLHGPVPTAQWALRPSLMTVSTTLRIRHVASAWYARLRSAPDVCPLLVLPNTLGNSFVPEDIKAQRQG